MRISGLKDAIYGKRLASARLTDSLFDGSTLGIRGSVCNHCLMKSIIAEAQSMPSYQSYGTIAGVLQSANYVMLSQLISS